MEPNQTFIANLLADRPAAVVQQVLDAYGEQGSAVKVVETLIFPAMRQLGDMWQRDEIAVEDEHQATQLVQFALSALRNNARRAPFHGGTAVVACVERERHSLGARTLSLLLELDGWKVSFHNSNTARDTLIEEVREQRPLLVALSSQRVETIRALRKTALELLGLDPPPALIVGGASTWALEHPQWALPESIRRVRDVSEALLFAREVLARSFTQPEDSQLRRHVGGKLKELREAKELSSRELARKVGMSTSRLRAIEQGTTLSLSALIRISDLLGVPIAEFFPSTETSERDPLP